MPGFVLIAEVYWDLEWRLQQLGFDFTYDKRLYDRLLDDTPGAPQGVRQHLLADAAYQRRSARFIENHDEARSVVAFGDRVRRRRSPSARCRGCASIYDGQFEGRRVRLPVQLGAMADEPVDDALRRFYAACSASPIRRRSMTASGGFSTCRRPATTATRISSRGDGAAIVPTHCASSS